MTFIESAASRKAKLKSKALFDIPMCRGARLLSTLASLSGSPLTASGYDDPYETNRSGALKPKKWGFLFSTEFDRLFL
jgi:hypothetical protein